MSNRTPSRTSAEPPKLEEIMSRVLRLEALANDKTLTSLAKSNPALQSLLEALATEAGRIYYLAEDARTERQAQETVMQTQRARIRELEWELEQLESHHE